MFLILIYYMLEYAIFKRNFVKVRKICDLKGFGKTATYAVILKLHRKARQSYPRNRL
jgi:hypothetical protein